MSVAPPLPPRPPGLAEYEEPPVDEVVIGLQFLGLPTMAEALVADYRELVKAEYPSVQYQPHLPPTPPLGQVTVLPGPGMMINPPVTSQTQDSFNRVWLVSPDESLLIQVQNDRFIHNWRRRLDDYPRFDRLYEIFWERLIPFRQLIEGSGEKLSVQQLEVSYTNWILDSEMQPPQYLAAASAGRVTFDYIAADQEQSMWQGIFLLRENGVPVARLLAQCQGGAIRVARNDVERGSTFGLTFLAALEPGASDERIVELMVLGHRTIVDAFTQLTTPEAHRRWRIKV